LFLWLGWFLTKTILSTIDSGEGLMATAKNFQILIEGYGNWGW